MTDWQDKIEDKHSEKIAEICEYDSCIGVSDPVSSTTQEIYSFWTSRFDASKRTYGKLIKWYTNTRRLYFLETSGLLSRGYFYIGTGITDANALKLAKEKFESEIKRWTTAK